MFTEIFIEVIGTGLIVLMAVALLTRIAQLEREFQKFFEMIRKNSDSIAKANEKMLEIHNNISRSNQSLVERTKRMSSRLEEVHLLAAERWEMLDKEGLVGSNNDFKGAVR